MQSPPEYCTPSCPTLLLLSAPQGEISLFSDIWIKHKKVEEEEEEKKEKEGGGGEGEGEGGRGKIREPLWYEVNNNTYKQL